MVFANKRILFVCIGNSCRSQMAEGFAKSLPNNCWVGKDKLEVFSAGSNPAKTVDPSAIAVMGELGIDISHQIPKGFSNLPYQKFDYVITMGCDIICPFYPAKEKIYWEIEDPKGKSIEVFRKARDQIKEKVKTFLEHV